MTTIVGLTGGIACGKSFVSAILAQKGARIIDLDLIAREVVRPGTEGLAAIVEEFGPEILSKDGTLNRQKLGRLIFARQTAREALDDLMAPLINRQLGLDIQYAVDLRIPIVVIDAALLFESGVDSSCDGGVIVVDCDPDEQISRLAARNGFSIEEALARIQAQMDAQERRNRAKWIIDNRGPFRDLKPDIDRIWGTLQP